MSLAVFFGSVKEAPFTKRSLKKLNQEQSENDATKTIEVFNAMRAEDPEFTYSVQVDEEGRVKTLMWTVGRIQHKVPRNVLIVLQHRQRKGQLDALAQVAAKHHMSNQIRGLGSVLSAEVKVTRAPLIRNEEIFQRRRGSRLDAPDAAYEVTGRTLAPTRPKQTLETDFRMACI